MKMGTVVKNISRSSSEQLRELASAGTATVHEALGRINLMQPYMRPIYAGASIAGNAVTALVHPGDNWMIHVAVEQCRPGDVLVVAVSAENHDGMFGDLLATSCHRCRRPRCGAIARDAIPRMVEMHLRQGND
jgi:4-hydroxy-4-methyl-2-oxoglutarate aldolase